MSRLIDAFGERIETGDAQLTHLTPTADRLASASVAEIREIGLPNTRAATLHALATHVAKGDVSTSEVARLSTRWSPWRAYAAMRLWLYGTVEDSTARVSD